MRERRGGIERKRGGGGLLGRPCWKHSERERFLKMAERICRRAPRGRPTKLLPINPKMLYPTSVCGCGRTWQGEGYELGPRVILHLHSSFFQLSLINSLHIHTRYIDTLCWVSRMQHAEVWMLLFRQTDHVQHIHWTF